MAKYKIEIETKTFTKYLFSENPPITENRNGLSVLRVDDDEGQTSLYNWADVVVCRYHEK